MSDKRKYSSVIVDGVPQAPSRAMLRAVGFEDADFKKPQVGVASTWSMVTPCNMHINELADESIKGVNAAGGKGVLFNTITVSDGISMGTPGMRYSLVSREVIADSIETVVGGQGFDGVVTIGPAASVADAANMLSTRKIGSVVVSSDNKTALGILSERDIVREVARSGSACLTLSASEVMTCDIKCCEPTDSTDGVMERMTEGRFRHMPVRQNGEMIGVISIGDVVKARLRDLHMEKEALTGMIMGN